jgi:hypothetical protein
LLNVFILSGESSVGSIKEAEMHDNPTLMCPEMVDGVVAADKVVKPSCHVAVQTCGFPSYSIACQTIFTTHNTCAVQTDGITILHTANKVSHPEGKFDNFKLSEKKTTDAAVQTQCLSDSGIENNCNLNSYGALIKAARKERLFSVTSKQNCVESKSKNRSTMIRCDYEKPEKCLREELKKWQSLVAWLCSDKSDEMSPLKSDDSSIPTPTAESITNKQLTHKSTQTTDKVLLKEVLPASSGLFTVEGTPNSSWCCKGMHPDWLMPVVPCFQHHMGSFLFQPKLTNCKLTMPSMAMPSKRCCHENACSSVNHCCVSQTAHTHQELKNYCCCLCVKTNHSNHKSHECEKLKQLSYMRSTSDEESVKQAWKRNVDTEESSDGWETGENHKRPKINSTSSAETDSEIENTGLRRLGICAEEQDSCMGTGTRRKQFWERRKAERRGRKYRTAGSRKTSACLKDNHLQTGSSSDTQQRAGTCSRFQKRRNKHNEDHKKDCRNCISEKMLGKNFPLPKLKHRPKHQMCGQLNEHTENGDTSVTKVCSEFDIGQSDIDSMKNCNTKTQTNLQSNAVQKTEDAMEGDTHKHLSYTELFGNISDVSVDDEQQSGRIAAQLETVQAEKVSGSSSNKRKRRAQVESRSMDCANFEMQNSKRKKIDAVNKENNDSVTSQVYETASNILLRSISESNPEKCSAITCKASTGISFASGEQTHLDQDCNISSANGSSLMLEHRVGACKTGQTESKTDVSQGAGARTKLSKLEKLRRNLIRAKMPSKIAVHLPVKSVEDRKKLTPRSEASYVASEFNRPRVKNVSEIATEDETPNSVSTTSNLSYRQLHQTVPALILENEKPPTKYDTTTHNTAYWLVNNHDNPVDNRLFHCNSVTSSSTHVTKEPDNETNHAVDVSKRFASKDKLPDAEMLQKTVSHVSEIQTNSSSTDRAPETVKAFALPISYKENMSEASQISENVGLVTLPNTCIEGNTRRETVSELCSQNLSSETCQTAVNFKGIKSPATVPNIGELEDIICPNFCQESLPCPVSPIEDAVMGEPQINSTAFEQLIRSQDAIQAAKLPVDALNIDSLERPTGSSMHKQTGKQLTMMKNTVTKKTDEKLFPGCVLQWVLKDYEAEYKKKNLKKSKSVMSQLKDTG